MELACDQGDHLLLCDQEDHLLTCDQGDHLLACELINKQTMNQFISYKNANKDIPPELVEYIRLNDHKGKYRQKHYTPHNVNYQTVPKKKNNWILNKRDNLTDDEKLYYNYRSVLNKISDSNLGELYKEIISFELKSAEHLEKLVDLVFSKAVSENKFVITYAKLSKLLMTFKITLINVNNDNNDNLTKDIYFKSLLINKCQNMFNYVINLQNQELDQKDGVFMFKDQVLGCIEYIGQLYNYDMLSDKIIYSCFMLLFAKNINDPYIVDIICKLMRTVGAKFSRISPNDVKTCFAKIEQLITDENINTKDKFAIMDLLDLKNSEKW
jgi:DNA-directed RNA polymerase subunit F